jgi:hypothetical protein
LFLPEKGPGGPGGYPPPMSLLRSLQEVIVDFGRHVLDPVKFGKWLWPHITFYKEQREAMYSVVENGETYVSAGNMLGKDFVAAYIVLWFFLTRHPVRIVTTSVDGSQLEGVLWGEIRRLIQEAQFSLDRADGGPIVNNHLHLKKVVGGKECGLSYCLGRVAAKGEGMLGHHIAETGDGIPRTLFVADEASGVDDVSYTRSKTWARRKLVIGNPYPCDNFFKAGVLAGDQPNPSWSPASRPGVPRYYRRVIRITGDDSPNVKLARAQRRAGGTPTGEILVPGVLPWADYEERRATWDEVMQCVGLDAQFYEGPDQRLVPWDWLERSAVNAAGLEEYRPGLSVGIDSAQGSDKTSRSVVDLLGLIEQEASRTPDTSVITGDTIAFGRYYGVPPEVWLFDRGGGGKEHADRLRRQGYWVRTVGFGEAVSREPGERGRRSRRARVAEREQKYRYKNRRAEMYGTVRNMLNPALGGNFAIPRRFKELRRQLSLIPLLYDSEGRLYLPAKRRKAGDRSPQKTLEELMGCSPDEADSLVLAVHGMADAVPGARRRAGALR